MLQKFMQIMGDKSEASPADYMVTIVATVAIMVAVAVALLV